MQKKETISFSCPCEKEHRFAETFAVEGEGQSVAQVRCPNALCPAKNPLLTYPIPFRLARENVAIKGLSDERKP